MKNSIKNRKKKFLALCLSALMFSSVAALASCADKNATDSSSSSSSVATEEKDTGLIKNANFKTFNADNAINTSATGWSRSVNSAPSGSALSSKAASGIIDLSEDAWKNLTGSYYENPDEVKKLTEAQAEAVWDKLTVRDKLAYYDQWKKDHSDGKISQDLKFYESINIDSGDIPTIDRFETHHKETDEGYAERDSKVLMIHNEYPESDSTATYKALGTAQKYTSSSTVTVKAGSSAKFSVWVKTQDLKSSSTEGAPQEAVDKGAYISITHSVGGKSLDEYKVENINTENMDEGTLSNGWKQYTFLIKGSSYADTTFSVVLGLGQGGGTYRGEYVNGYAFFDDIECELISNNTFETSLTELNIDKNDIRGFEHEGEDKVVNVAATANVDRNAFAMDFYGEFKQTANDVLANVTAKPTESEIKGEILSSLKGDAPTWLKGGLDGTKDVKKVFANAAEIEESAANTNNEYLKAVYDNYFADNNFSKDKQTLLLMSTNGVAYTADLGYNFELRTPRLNENGGPIKNDQDLPTYEKIDYLALSFFVKTSDMSGYTGAGISLVDGNNKTSFSSIDTTSITPVKIGDNEDVYEGWQQCFFFIENASDDALITTEDDEVTSFTLSFNFGPTAIEEGTSIDNYHPGFAAFTNFQVYSMTKDEYASAQSGTYAKLVSVKGDKEEEKTNTSGFDTAAGVPSNAIETGLAHLQNYKGVYSNSAYITGGINDSTNYNTYANAGLVSKEFFTADDGYFTSSNPWLDGIKNLVTVDTNSELSASEQVWNTVFGKDANRPLLIWHDSTLANKAYGYIGTEKTVAANSYSAISVRVKVSANAKASVYLIDTAEGKYNSTLSIGRNLTYWYDDNGNICTGDPSEKATQVAFRLQTNGLYKADKNWDGYDATMENLWFANLEAYATDPITENKMVAEGGAFHNYNDYWNNEGLDGIAFYYNKLNKKYYADKALTIPVSNLAEVTALAPRYDAITNSSKPFATQKMSATITDTQGEWKVVTFYIHTGDTAKNYRLEVWSGTRDGLGNAENEYVIFDTYNPGDATSNFTGLLEEFEDKVADNSKFYGVFSYFDTANYLRYNANLDEKGDGNLYKDNYVPSSYAEGIAFLKYETEEEYTVFADYQYSEKTVTKSEPVEDEETDTEDSTTEPTTNIWLLASSLIIAIVLVLVVVLLAVRKIMKKVRKNRALRK